VHLLETHNCQVQCSRENLISGVTASVGSCRLVLSGRRWPSWLLQYVYWTLFTVVSDSRPSWLLQYVYWTLFAVFSNSYGFVSRIGVVTHWFLYTHDFWTGRRVWMFRGFQRGRLCLGFPYLFSLPPVQGRNSFLKGTTVSVFKIQDFNSPSILGRHYLLTYLLKDFLIISCSRLLFVFQEFSSTEA
jgi:hypothetical protein